MNFQQKNNKGDGKNKLDMKKGMNFSISNVITFLQKNDKEINKLVEIAKASKIDNKSARLIAKYCGNIDMVFSAIYRGATVITDSITVINKKLNVSKKMADFKSIMSIFNGVNEMIDTAVSISAKLKKTSRSVAISSKTIAPMCTFVKTLDELVDKFANSFAQKVQKVTNIKPKAIFQNISVIVDCLFNISKKIIAVASMLVLSVPSLIVCNAMVLALAIFAKIIYREFKFIRIKEIIRIKLSLWAVKSIVDALLGISGKIILLALIAIITIPAIMIDILLVLAMTLFIKVIQILLRVGKVRLKDILGILLINLLIGLLFITVSMILLISVMGKSIKWGYVFLTILGVVGVVILLVLLGILIGNQYVLAAFGLAAVGLIAVCVIIGLLLIISLMLWAIGKLRLDKDVIVDNVKTIIEVVKEMIIMLFETISGCDENDSALTKMGKFLFIGPIAFLASMATLIMAIPMLFYSFFVVGIIYLIANILNKMQELRLDKNAITNTVSTVLGTIRDMIMMLLLGVSSDELAAGGDDKTKKMGASLFSSLLAAGAFAGIMAVGATGAMMLQYFIGAVVAVLAVFAVIWIVAKLLNAIAAVKVDREGAVNTIKNVMQIIRDLAFIFVTGMTMDELFGGLTSGDTKQTGSTILNAIKNNIGIAAGICGLVTSFVVVTAALLVFAVMYAVAGLINSLGQMKINTADAVNTIKNVMSVIKDLALILFTGMTLDEFFNGMTSGDTKQIGSTVLNAMKGWLGAAASVIGVVISFAIVTVAILTFSVMWVVAKLIVAISNIKIDKQAAIATVSNTMAVIKELFFTLILGMTSDELFGGLTSGDVKQTGSTILNAIKGFIGSVASVFGIVLSFVVVTAALLSFSVIWCVAKLIVSISNIKIDKAAVNKTVKNVFTCIKDVSTILFFGMTEDDIVTGGTDAGGIGKTMIKMLGGFVQTYIGVLGLIYSIPILLISVISLGLVYCVGNLLTRIGEMKIDSVAITENVKFILGTVKSVVEILFGYSPEPNEKREKDDWIDTVLGYVETYFTGITTMMGLVLSVPILLISIVSLGLIYCVASLLSSIATIELDEGVITDKIQSILACVRSVNQGILTPNDTGESYTSKRTFLDYLKGKFGTMVDVAVSLASSFATTGILIATIPNIMLLKVVANVIQDVANININSSAVIGKVKAIVDVAKSVSKAILNPPPPPPPPPPAKSKNILQRGWEYIKRGAKKVANVVSTAFSAASEVVSNIGASCVFSSMLPNLTMLASVTSALHSVIDIPFGAAEQNSIQNKVNLIIKTSEMVCEQVSQQKGVGAINENKVLSFNKFVDGNIKYFNNINKLDSSKVKSLSDMYARMTEFMEALKDADINGIADALVTKISPALDSIDSTLEEIKKLKVTGGGGGGSNGGGDPEKYKTGEFGASGSTFGNSASKAFKTQAEEELKNGNYSAGKYEPFLDDIEGILYEIKSLVKDISGK